MLRMSVLILMGTSQLVCGHEIHGAVQEETFRAAGDSSPRFLDTLQVQEEKLRKISIEYDKELYPHLVSAVAERR